MLGIWRATVVQGGLNWILTLQSNPDGTYHLKAPAGDSGTRAAVNHQWRTTSTVTGLSNMGTYRVVDARNVEFLGPTGTAVWKRL
jgi:hypothetical protein